MSLSIEQRLLVLSEAIKHESFEMDAKRVRAILVEAADTICKLRRSNVTVSGAGGPAREAAALSIR